MRGIRAGGRCDHAGLTRVRVHHPRTHVCTGGPARRALARSASLGRAPHAAAEETRDGDFLISGAHAAATSGWSSVFQKLRGFCPYPLRPFGDRKGRWWQPQRRRWASGGRHCSGLQGGPLGRLPALGARAEALGPVHPSCLSLLPSVAPVSALDPQGDPPSPQSVGLPGQRLPHRRSPWEGRAQPLSQKFSLVSRSLQRAGAGQSPKPEVRPVSREASPGGSLMRLQVGPLRLARPSEGHAPRPPVFKDLKRAHSSPGPAVSWAARGLSWLPSPGAWQGLPPVEMLPGLWVDGGALRMVLLPTCGHRDDQSNGLAMANTGRPEADASPRGRGAGRGGGVTF